MRIALDEIRGTSCHNTLAVLEGRPESRRKILKNAGIAPPGQSPEKLRRFFLQICSLFRWNVDNSIMAATPSNLFKPRNLAVSQCSAALIQLKLNALSCKIALASSPPPGFDATQ